MKHLLHALVWARRHRAGALPAPELPPLLPLLAPDDIVYDVGVHAGSWTLPASRAIPRGHVYAFEALPYYARVLRTMLRLFGRRNVTVTNAAVSDAEGEVEILWKDPGGQRLTGRTRIRRADDAGETVRVRAVTLDAFRREHPRGRLRLLKCDVEGAELLVLRGAAETIAASRPIVFLELYDEYCRRFGYVPADVFSFFAERRYRPLRFTGAAFEPLAAETYGASGDVLFLPAELSLERSCG